MAERRSLHHSTWRRRSITISATMLGGLLAVTVAPVTVPVAWLVDLLRGDRHLPRRTLTVTVTVILAHEALTLVLLAFLWVGRAARRRSPTERTAHAGAIIARYSRRVLALLSWAIGAPVHWQNDASFGPGPLVFAARHTSFYDAVIPGAASHRYESYAPLHVLAQELRMAPAVDIAAGWLPSQFIDRSSAAVGRSIRQAEDLGQSITPTRMAVIFPEGTFRSPKRFAAAVQRAERRAPDRVPVIANLRHTLPPRSQGTWALLQGAPDAALVICASTGLERWGSVAAIRRAGRATRPIVIATWRLERAEIPDDPDTFERWLLDRWVEIDDWVATTSGLEKADLGDQPES